VAGPIVLYCVSLALEDEGRFLAAEHLQAAALILAGLALLVLFGTWAEKRQIERIEREWEDQR
jgi:hypothetical protein